MSDTVTVYSLNGAPSGAPTALYVYGGTPLAADASFVFDVAFDIAGPDQVTILPLRAVASGLVSTHAVGLATLSQAYEDVTAIPKGTSFRADTAMTVFRDQVVLVQVDESLSACASSTTSTYIYAKLVVRAIDQENRTLQVEYVVDPNCGFRSFEAGLPEFLVRPTVKVPDFSSFTPGTRATAHLRVHDGHGALAVITGISVLRHAGKPRDESSGGCG